MIIDGIREDKVKVFVSSNELIFALKLELWKKTNVDDYSTIQSGFWVNGSKTIRKATPDEIAIMDGLYKLSETLGEV